MRRSTWRWPRWLTSESPTRRRLTRTHCPRTNGWSEVVRRASPVAVCNVHRVALVAEQVHDRPQGHLAGALVVGPHRVAHLNLLNQLAASARANAHAYFGFYGCRPTSTYWASELYRSSLAYFQLRNTIQIHDSKYY
jgi:hypothetical protein